MKETRLKVARHQYALVIVVSIAAIVLGLALFIPWAVEWSKSGFRF